VQGQEHFERAMALYHPTDHCELTTRMGQDIRVTILSYRSWALSLSGHAESALAAADEALSDARSIGHASTLMYALCNVSLVHIWNGNYAIANAVIDELNSLTNAKGALFWKGLAIATQGYLVALTGNASKAIDMITSGIRTYRSSGGSTVWLPMYLSSLASANAKLREFDAASRCTYEALALVKTTGESWYEAEVNRIAGEVVLLARGPEAARAETYFEHALTVARRQQAKAWELRAAISMARRWRDQGKRDEARDLLVPVYDWFTEGFDTLDLKEAKALLGELAS
jgi:predicted ATPase